jgi:hypothetical protein
MLIRIKNAHNYIKAEQLLHLSPTNLVVCLESWIALLRLSHRGIFANSE